MTHAISWRAREKRSVRGPAVQNGAQIMIEGTAGFINRPVRKISFSLKNSVKTEGLAPPPPRRGVKKFREIDSFGFQKQENDLAGPTQWWKKILSYREKQRP